MENFASSKQQLIELASVLNEFKSEAVQLRILEFVLNGAVPHPQGSESSAPKGHKKRTFSKRAKASEKAASATEKKPKKARSSKGASSALNEMLSGDFFKTPRTINDIVDESRTNLALVIKANEFSGKLARAVRNGQLKRRKNADQQFEYTIS